MKFIKTYLLPILTLIALIAVSILWTEADREIRILCQVAESFETTSELDRLISTAENSRLFYEAEGEYSLKSHQNLRTSECVFKTSDTALVSAEHYSYFSLPENALKINVALTGFLVLFQISLAAGLPFGYMAWGGRDRILPGKLKIASLITAVFLLIIMMIFTEAGGITGFFDQVPAINDLLWSIFALFFVSSIANTFSKSATERKLMLPLSVIMATCSFIFALNA